MNSMKRLAAGSALAALALASATAVYAQETTASLHGMVSANGAVVPNAAVTVVHTPSGTRAVTATNEAGTFDARGLRVGGPYTVTVTAPGLEAKTYEGLFLTVGKTADLDADLSANSVASVVVSAASRRNNEQGPKTVLNRDDLNAVVTVTRDPRDYARRDMLVAQDLNGGRGGTNAGGISIAGSNPRFNRISVDGVAAQDNFGLAQGGLATSRGPVTLDAIEQFAVAAVPTDVENGDFIGGALNLVLRSGGNSFHGALFDNYLNEGMVGRHYSDTRVPQLITQKNYGGFLSGPILKDKLFFAVSYETYETTDVTQFGVAGSGAANVINGLPARGGAPLQGMTQATLDDVVNTYNNTYASDYALGGITPTAPVTDKKYSAKIDWNISDRHRASLTYRYAESASYQRTDLGQFTAALFSHWYQQFNSDEATTAEIHSNWTDNLSTTFKATYRDYRNGQNPPGGQNFSDVRVCTADVPDAATAIAPQSCASGFGSVYFGPDQFRHANALDEQETRYQALAEYSFRGNRFKIGAQARKADVFDVFVPNSHGQYYFDTLADYKAGRASQLTYANAVSGNANDAAFNSTYWTYSLFGQDTIDITDNLRVSAGVRFDWYDEPDVPILNPNFAARNGYTNQKTIDGLHVLMPRVSAEWNPTDSLRFTGGFGLFAGGSPDVLTGIAFYNTGYATTQVTIQRQADGTFIETGGTPGFTQAIGAAALNGLNADPTFGLKIPTIVQQLQQGTLTGAPAIPPLGEAIALTPTFQMPAQWKVYLSGEWRGPQGWNVTANYVATQAQNEITYYDSRAQPLVINGVQQFLPDGRVRYDGLGTAVPGKSSVNLGSNRDIVVANTNKGDSYTASVQVAKRWDWGGDVSLGYARQNMNDISAGLFFGTTASSLYGGVAAGMDPNRDYLGRSVYEIENRWKAEFGFRKKFFGDNESRVSLFAERQDGRPFGFYMNDSGSGRSKVFGVNRTAQMLYVPDFAADTNPNDRNVGIVTFATQADLDRFKAYVKRFDLPTGLVSKNSNSNAPVNRLDMQLSQEFPTFIQGHKIKAQLDIRNVLNLINRDWGLVSEYGDTNTLARVDCANGAGDAVGATDGSCSRYRYSSVATSVTKTRNTGLSLWYAQFSLRYEF